MRHQEITNRVLLAAFTVTLASGCASSSEEAPPVQAAERPATTRQPLSMFDTPCSSSDPFAIEVGGSSFGESFWDEPCSKAESGDFWGVGGVWSSDIGGACGDLQFGGIEGSSTVSEEQARDRLRARAEMLCESKNGYVGKNYCYTHTVSLLVVRCQSWPGSWKCDSDVVCRRR